MHGHLFLALCVAGIGLRSEAAGFPDPAVWPVQIEITAENAGKLRARPRESVSAKVRILNKEAHNAKVRLKGRGTFQSLDGKPSFTIELEKDVRREAFGLSKFHLNNSVEDPSFLKERIGSEIFEAAAIPTPRA